MTETGLHYKNSVFFLTWKSESTGQIQFYYSLPYRIVFRPILLIYNINIVLPWKSMRFDSSWYFMNTGIRVNYPMIGPSN